LGWRRVKSGGESKYRTKNGVKPEIFQNDIYNLTSQSNSRGRVREFPVGFMRAGNGEGFWLNSQEFNLIILEF